MKLRFNWGSQSNSNSKERTTVSTYNSHTVRHGRTPFIASYEHGSTQPTTSKLRVSLPFWTHPSHQLHDTFAAPPTLAACLLPYVMLQSHLHRSWNSCARNFAHYNCLIASPHLFLLCQSAIGRISNHDVQVQRLDTTIEHNITLLDEAEFLVIFDIGLSWWFQVCHARLRICLCACQLV